MVGHLCVSARLVHIVSRRCPTRRQIEIVLEHLRNVPTRTHSGAILRIFKLVFQLLVLLLEHAQQFFVVALRAVQRLDALALVFDKFLVRDQILLHGLASLVHLLHSGQLRVKLLVRCLQQRDLLVVVLDHQVFLVKLGLEDTCGLLEFGQLLGQHPELFFHQVKIVLCGVELLLEFSLLCLHLKAVLAGLGSHRDEHLLRH